MKKKGIIFLEIFCRNYFTLIFAVRNREREFSSVGLEHLPYKQRVRGSNPRTPTKASQKCEAF